MNILLTNDDGVDSIGLITLAKVLSKKHKITIVAPNCNYSSCSQLLNIGKKLYLKKIENDFCVSYSFSGSPADCVKFAIKHFGKVFDLVIAGINLGGNLGNDVIYSGTVAAAMEGLYMQTPALALSSVDASIKSVENLSKFVDENLDKLINLNDISYFYNVNYPASEHVGYKFAKLGKREYDDKYREVEENVFVMGGSLIENSSENEGTDTFYISKNYITIVPLRLDRTDYCKLEDLNNKNV